MNNHEIIIFTEYVKALIIRISRKLHVLENNKNAEKIEWKKVEQKIRQNGKYRNKNRIESKKARKLDLFTIVNSFMGMVLNIYSPTRFETPQMRISYQRKLCPRFESETLLYNNIHYSPKDSEFKNFNIIYIYDIYIYIYLLLYSFGKVSHQWSVMCNSDNLAIKPFKMIMQLTWKLVSAGNSKARPRKVRVNNFLSGS